MPARIMLLSCSASRFEHRIWTVFPEAMIVTTSFRTVSRWVLTEVIDPIGIMFVPVPLRVLRPVAAMEIPAVIAAVVSLAPETFPGCTHSTRSG